MRRGGGRRRGNARLVARLKAVARTADRLDLGREHLRKLALGDAVAQEDLVARKGRRVRGVNLGRSTWIDARDGDDAEGQGRGNQTTHETLRLDPVALGELVEELEEHLLDAGDDLEAGWTSKRSVDARQWKEREGEGRTRLHRDGRAVHAARVVHGPYDRGDRGRERAGRRVRDVAAEDLREE